MVNGSNIFVVESENSKALREVLNEKNEYVSLDDLLTNKEKFGDAILFFEDSLDIEFSLIEKIIFSNPGLILILFYKEQIDNKKLSEYFKIGVSDSVVLDDKEHLKQILERYSTGADESKVILYNNLINRFKEIGIISTSLKMAEIFSIIDKVGKSNSTVLISGESGTGKELIAKSIHYFSKRREQNFVGINTGAIPENLLEDELFGHVKGAFTNALKDRKGKFEYADKGTVFLDEISNMPMPLQVKLLRVLQEREFERVGDNKTIRVDVRVVAATNRDLEEMVKKGDFREDLFFRLNIIPIRIPPLRERKSDIPILVNYFIKKYCSLNGYGIKSISVSALRILKDYSWPGNIRHLENTVERMVVLNPDSPILSPKDIPEEIVRERNEIKSFEDTMSVIPDEGIALNDILRSIERKYIMQSLEKTSGNKQKAASLLNIKRTTLIEKLKKFQR